MTGRYPMRFGFESNPNPPQMAKWTVEMREQRDDEGSPLSLFHEDLVDRVPPQAEQGVPTEEITIAELLRDNGSHTLMLGKWHLGEGEGLRPEDQGFDEFLGFRAGSASAIELLNC